MTFGSYNFLQDSNDMLNGVVPTDFAASYRDVEVAMFEGTIVLENAPKGRRFNLTYKFTDGTTDTASAKLLSLQALKGTIDILVKDNVTLSGVMLKTVSIQSRRGVEVPFTTTTSSTEEIIVSIGFHKVD